MFELPGPNGNLVMLTATTSFSQSGTFNVNETPGELGTLSEANLGKGLIKILSAFEIDDFCTAKIADDPCAFVAEIRLSHEQI